MATLKSRLLNSSALGNQALSILSLVLRLAIGGAMLTHGMAKVMSFSELSATFPDPIGVGSTAALVLAIGAEVGCSIFLIFGLLTRLALLPLMFTMTMAFFVVQASAPFATRELALIYLLVYIAIFAIGAGRYSIDNMIVRK